MKTSELRKILRANGCYVVREGTNYEIWFSPITGKKFPVLRHGTKEMATGTVNSILRSAGIV